MFDVLTLYPTIIHHTFLFNSFIYVLCGLHMWITFNTFNSMRGIPYGCRSPKRKNIIIATTTMKIKSYKQKQTSNRKAYRPDGLCVYDKIYKYIQYSTQQATACAKWKNGILVSYIVDCALGHNNLFEFSFIL